uniref:Putative ovule protein n=1 Tax=Solanum chacoense TaxID=4108 RepID=A0A0V0HZP7_SOLCH
MEVVQNGHGKCFGRQRLQLQLLTSAHEASLTQDKLQTRGLIYVAGTICEREGESVNHSSIHCMYVWQIWCVFLSLYGF